VSVMMIRVAHHTVEHLYVVSFPNGTNPVCG
jgi:hypothetical protein